MHHLKAIKRLIKWAIELGEFDIMYRPRTDIKAQALVDFVVECTITNQEVGGQEEIDKPVQEQGQKEKKDLEMTPKEYWKLYFDGASNIRESGAGLVLQSPEGFIVE